MRRTAFAVAAAALVLLALAPAVSGAQEGHDEGGEYPAESVMLIMDASGSMNRTDPDGVPLIDGAKQALRVLVSALPDDAAVGLRVYGHRVDNSDKANGCLDTELVVPVGPLDRDAMTAAIDGYEARGWTPIGLSLREAAADLPPAGRRTIVLVSDGIDTCAPPDPCEVAAELAAEGLALRIHTVGLFLDDPAAEEQLQCIAGAAGGEFRRADSIVDLVRDLTGIVASSLEGDGDVRPVVIGALDRLDAPVLALERGGSEDWLAYGLGVFGTISAGETRWYAVDVDDTRPWQMTATGNFNEWVLEPAADDAVSIRIVDSDGEDVGHTHAVLGVTVDVPDRMPLVDAARWVPFGDPIRVEAVTDPRAAPPAWPGWEAEDPYLAGMAERMREEGINGGLYDTWTADRPAPGLAPGRYYVGFTWESEAPGTSELDLGVTLYPAGEEAGERTAVPWVLADGAGPEEDPVLLGLQPWEGDPIGPLTPLRAVEVWGRITPGTASSYAVDLAEGEMLQTAWRQASGYSPSEGEVTVVVLDPDGARMPQAGEQLDGLTGYDTDVGWLAPADGRYTVEVRSSGDLLGEDSGVVLGLFAFEAEDPLALEPGASSPTVAVATPAEPDEDEGEGNDGIVVVALLGAGVLALATAGAWWWRRRR
ncbi:MAG: VWA domain-containing protein [Actinobacteria bacterium]|nr:VWA domain-containing protein [Actinomycetota bacterium]